ncbi:winged helix DNA-binding domain-containing protein [Actinoallomurus bryophytorum]|uniref:winged helix DNA-binding domain-containing protein n=1 Tax=Actinoallomurus bryophytorum TaxID=1490222 RepID=UPI001FEC0483|nr:winged helix DNA-binding domain-containing protein [Actinoallomurus bryophytorum]
METVTWDQILAWRMGRQFLAPAVAGGPAYVTGRLAGVQAQVASAAKLTIALRQTELCADSDAVEIALDVRTLVKTWAMRGTLHLLPADEAAAYLELSAAHRNWERGSWQRSFGATPADLETIAAAAAEALAGGAVLTREELTAEIVDRTGSAHLAGVLGSGWGTLLKPLAWWRVLCFGPPSGGRVTFTSAAWLPPVPDPAGTVLRAFLGAYGPATPELFDKVWLSRGNTPKAVLRSWFAALEGELAEVEVEGERRVMLAAHLDELLATGPSTAVRLLGPFDAYVLGGGTTAAEIVPPERRKEVSRAGGWISPVVLRGGRVVGVWGKEGVTLWDDVPASAVEAEMSRHERLRLLLGGSGP